MNNPSDAEITIAIAKSLNRRYERLLEVIELRAKSQDWDDWNFEAQYSDDVDFDTLWRERLEKRALVDESPRLDLIEPVDRKPG